MQKQGKISLRKKKNKPFPGWPEFLHDKNPHGPVFKKGWDAALNACAKAMAKELEKISTEKLENIGFALNDLISKLKDKS